MPSFSIYDDVHDTCGQWLSQKGRFCKNLAGQKHERPQAEELRRDLLLHDPWDPSLPRNLQKLATAVHCRRWHRTQEQISNLANHWLSELRASHHEPGRTTSDRRTNNLVQSDTFPDQRIPEDVQRIMQELMLQGVSIQGFSQISQPSQSAALPRPTTRSTTRTAAAETVVQPTDRALPPLPSSRPMPPFPSSRPLTRSTSSTATDAILRPPQSPFIPKPSAASALDLIADIVKKPLGPLDKKSGHIYIFTRQSDPGYVKIGFSKNPSRRVGQWGQTCRFQPTLEYTSPLIFNAHRIEQLIFAQLSGNRCYDRRCIDGNICNREHKEWFKISVQDAKKVVGQWVDWMEEDPYDDAGDLEEEWSEYIRPWLEYCRRRRLRNVLDLCFGCDLSGGQSDDAVGAERQTSGEECAICYDVIENADRHMDPCVRCGNTSWHDDCITHWLEQSPSCPMCRTTWTVPSSRVDLSVIM